MFSSSCIHVQNSQRSHQNQDSTSCSNLPQDSIEPTLLHHIQPILSHWLSSGFLMDVGVRWSVMRKLEQHFQGWFRLDTSFCRIPRRISVLSELEQDLHHSIVRCLRAQKKIWNQFISHSSSEYGIFRMIFIRQKSQNSGNNSNNSNTCTTFLVRPNSLQIIKHRIRNTNLVMLPTGLFQKIFLGMKNSISAAPLLW